MNFASLDFFAFALLFFVIWRLLPDIKSKRIFLLASSLAFYAWARPWHTLLLLGLSSLTWVCGQYFIKNRMRSYLAVGIVANLLNLAFFKYGDFVLAQLPGGHFTSLGLLLPLGISFYTFQNISYLVDLARGDAAPAPRLFDYLLYIAYFPHVIAGPIVRSRELLPQLLRDDRPVPNWNRAVTFISLGLFKKIALADVLGNFCNTAMASPGRLDGAVAWVAFYAYAFQIYFDFSGYTDIAEGLAAAMGFRLVENFRSPYLAADLREFWQRWHMSLSRWLRDYLYIPLGGSRKGTARTILALAATMVLGGLWHGASWNFALWGAYHGALLIGHRFWIKNSSYRLPKLLGQLITFHFVAIGWLIFRLHNLVEVAQFAGAMTKPWAFQAPIIGTGLLIAFAVWFHVWESRQESFDTRATTKPLAAPWLAALHGATAFAALMLVNGSSPFIYFRF